MRPLKYLPHLVQLLELQQLTSVQLKVKLVKSRIDEEIASFKEDPKAYQKSWKAGDYKDGSWYFQD